MKDTADFGANYFLRVLYLFGSLSALLSGRVKRRTFDEQRFMDEMVKEWSAGRSVSDSEMLALLRRVEVYCRRFADPLAVDLRFSTSIGAVLVDRSPQVIMLTLDGQHHFIQMPFVVAFRQTTAQFIRKLLPELQRPLAYRLVGDEEATARHQFFDIAEAQ